eukprot:GHVS01058388.1.p1 GENE.GHVS01058388.1~~GHVS01058388.1.p1  ORF type:complete len:361 (-),score=57.27 GHVS01058388.1:27-1109(-)
MGQGFLSSRCHYMGIQDHDYVVLGGDFNFRVNKSHDEVVAMLNAQREQELINHDQYILSRRHHVSPFGEFHEAPLAFRPTYKYRRNSNFYDLKRTPAWCDRILYGGKKCPPCFQQGHGHRHGRHRTPHQPHSLNMLQYQDHHRYFTSDHKPVSAFLTVPVVLRQSLVAPVAPLTAYPPRHGASAAVPAAQSPSASSSRGSVVPSETSTIDEHGSRPRTHRRHRHYHTTAPVRRRSGDPNVSSIGEPEPATSPAPATSSTQQPTTQMQAVDLLGLQDHPPSPPSAAAEPQGQPLRSGRSAGLLQSLLTTNEAASVQSSPAPVAADWTLVDLPEAARDKDEEAADRTVEKHEHSGKTVFDLM